MTFVLGIVMVWVLMAGAVGLLARVFQRSGLGWFLVSLIGSPPTGFACLLALRLTDPDGRFDISSVLPSFSSWRPPRSSSPSDCIRAAPSG
jgi:hypothetical protein